MNGANQNTDKRTLASLQQAYSGNNGAQQQQHHDDQHHAFQSNHNNQRRRQHAGEQLYDTAVSTRTAQAHRQPSSRFLARNPFQPVGSGARDSTGHEDKNQEEAAAAAAAAAKRPASFSLFASKAKKERKNVVEIQEQQQFKSPTKPAKSICAKLSEMARRRPYFAALLGLSLLVAVCLLAAVALSRTIGLPDLADSDTNNQQQLQQRLAAGALAAEMFEVRALELVDLIEHDKTFAYTKWQVKVKVLKATPAYKQHNLAAAATMNELTTAAQTNRPNAVRNLASDSNENDRDNNDDDEYHLTGTRAFVADHKNSATENATSEAGGNVDSAELEADLMADLSDPIQVAASELSVSAATVNSTLVDCFMVDLEKRYGQKVAAETLHRQVAGTRRVSFKKMLATITACRLLSWSSLMFARQSNATTVTTSSQRELATPQRATVAAVVAPDKPRQLELGGASRVSGARYLSEVIRPVEPQVAVVNKQRQTTTATTAQDPFNSIIGALINWSRMSNNTSGGGGQTSGGKAERKNSLPKLLGEEAQQAPAVTVKAAGGNASLASTTTATAAAAAEEEAKRASYLNMGMSMINGIVPQTLWCGLGDRASNYSELGAEFMVDACCRAHDHCPIRLKPFTADYGLINWSMSTRSHCDCDLDFNDCLTSINSTLSNVIKTLYFRLVGLQCIDLGADRRQQQQQQQPQEAAAQVETTPMVKV